MTTVPSIGPAYETPCISCGKMLDRWTIEKGRQFRDLKHIVPTPPPGKRDGPYCWNCKENLFKESK